MGVGALFLVMTARAQFESETSDPHPKPSPGDKHSEPELLIFPIVCFVVMGSVLVHGFSTGFISVYGHIYRRSAGEDYDEIPGGENDMLTGLVADGSRNGSVRSYGS